MVGGGHFTPGDIDPMLCTHVVFGYAQVVDNVMSFTGPSDDSESPHSLKGLGQLSW